jgi:hypothetical protein
MARSQATKRKSAPKQGPRKAAKNNKDTEKEEDEVPTYIGDGAAIKLLGQLKKIRRRKDDLDDNEGEEEEIINMKQKIHDTSIKDAFTAANNLRSTNYAESVQEDVTTHETVVLEDMLKKARRLKARHAEGDYSSNDIADTISASRAMAHDLVNPSVAISSTDAEKWKPKASLSTGKLIF